MSFAESPESTALEGVKVARPMFPEAMRFLSKRAFGKGSNNNVFKQQGSALWELRQTLKAAELGVAPNIHEAFYARHASREWTSGLYMIMDAYQCSLDDALMKDADRRHSLMRDNMKLGKALADKAVECLGRLADNLLFVYDLKPSNVVVTVDEEANRVDMRFVDFGTDFCEWDTLRDDPSARHHIIDGLRMLAASRQASGQPTDVERVVKHILFAAMLVQLSATTTFFLYDDRHDHKMTREQRRDANVFAPKVNELLESMQGQNLALLRWVLRNDEVRGVMRHYHGRRNAGTSRTLNLAAGFEVPCDEKSGRHAMGFLDC